MEHRALTRQLHLAEGVPKAQIARQLGISRTTVLKALAADTPPTFRTPPRPSAFDEYEPRVRVLLAEFPTMPATVVAERVGWSGSESWFRKRVALIRPDYAPKDPPIGWTISRAIRRSVISGSRRCGCRLEPGSGNRSRCW